MFGYMVTTAIPLRNLTERLEDHGIRMDRFSGKIALHDEAGNRVWGHAQDEAVKFFWRTARNNPSYIMQKLADVFGQVIFSDLPEAYGEDPLYLPEPWHPRSREAKELAQCQYWQERRRREEADLIWQQLAEDEHDIQQDAASETAPDLE